MGAIKAVLWDVDGTIAESERDGHRVAFNRAFEALGLHWRWSEVRYGELLYVTGGRERLLHDMTQRSDAPSTAGERETLARDLHRRKNSFYGELVAGGSIALRPGVAELMDECSTRGLRQGIVTTTSRVNVDALMQVHFGAAWRRRFDVVVCGEDVRHKKPDPEAYVRALESLGIAAPDAVAIEDSPGGVQAACAADVAAVVPLSAYFAHATIEGAVAIGPGLHSRRGWRPAPPTLADDADGPVRLDDLQRWCAERDSLSQFF